MGYIYEKVKSVLSSNSSSNGGHVISNWSPNMYRCIILGPSFIFIAKHIGVPQIISLDWDKVSEDISNYARGSGRGALHNLLAERQLSCLEEIYIDVVYKPFTNLIDLEKYIGSVKNSVSRLRYYGYCKLGVNNVWLVDAYKDCGVLYSLAKDSRRVFPIEYKEVGNPTWYKNYNLRPMYYKLDSDRGQLAIYFRKNEGIIEDALIKLENSDKINLELANIRKSVLYDIDKIISIRHLLKAIKYLNNPNYVDRSVDIVFSAIKSEVKKDRIVHGLTREKILKAFDNSTAQVEEIIRYYEMFKVLDIAGDNEVPKSEKGFLNISGMLDEICLVVAEKMYKGSNTKDIIALNMTIHKEEFPKGKLSLKYFNGNTDGTEEGYIVLLSEIIGTDIRLL